MESSVLAYAFTLGAVATVNPCGFAMLPAYVAFFLATEEADGPEKSSVGRRLVRALAIGGVLTAGFLILFVAAGGIISAGGYALMTAVPFLGLVLGLVLVALGLWLALADGRLPVPALPRVDAPRERSLRGIFLFGVAYGLTSLSCTLPLFLGVVGTSLTRGGVAQGSLQFLAYGLGMGSVLIALTVSAALFEGVLAERMRRLVPLVERIGAVALTMAGAYLVYYWTDALRLLYS
ncbi:MAG: cytochrome c biogenesis CcdA family protein [Anaerolineae bacterium]